MIEIHFLVTLIFSGSMLLLDRNGIYNPLYKSVFSTVIPMITVSMMSVIQVWDVSTLAFTIHCEFCFLFRVLNNFWEKKSACMVVTAKSSLSFLIKCSHIILLLFNMNSAVLNCYYCHKLY